MRSRRDCRRGLAPVAGQSLLRGACAAGATAVNAVASSSSSVALAATDTTTYVGAWSGRPDAAASAGLSIVATDIGGRSTFYSDGTDWRPVGGRAVLGTLAGSVSMPVASGSSAGGAAFLLGLPGGAIRVPAGLLVPRQSLLRISAYWSKSGNAGPINCVTCLGTTNSFSDSQISGTFIGPAATAVWNMQVDVSVDTTSRLQSNALAVVNGAAAAPVAAGEFASQIDTTQDMFVNFGATSAAAGDGLMLTRVMVEVFL